MKKNIVFLIPCFFLITSCISTGVVRYHAAEGNISPSSEDVSLASVQVDMSDATWSTNNGETVTTYHMTLDNGNFVIAAINEKIGINVVPFSLSPEQRIEWYSQMQSRGIQPSKYHYSIANGIVVTDSEPDQMDSSTLEVLNKSSQDKYYMVLDFDFPDIRLGKWYNFYDFRILGEMAVIIYDRSGKKVQSKHFYREFTHVKTRISDFATYQNVIDVMIWENKDYLLSMLPKVQSMEVNKAGNSI